MEAIWSQDLVPSDGTSTGCPIWTPSSVTMPGITLALAEKLFTSPISQCAVQAAASRLVESERASLNTAAALLAQVQTQQKKMFSTKAAL